MHGKCHCSAVNCKNTARFNEGIRILSFYRFPKDKERCAIWVKNCGRTDLQLKSPEYLYSNCRLCSDHFEQSQKFKSSQGLIWNAIPTLFDHPNKPEPLTSKKRDLPAADEAIKPTINLSNKPETLPAVDEAISSPQTQRRQILADHGYCVKQTPENGPQLRPDGAENVKQINNTIFQRTAASISAEHGYCVPKNKQAVWVWKQIDPSLISRVKPQSTVPENSHKNDTQTNLATSTGEGQNIFRVMKEAEAKRNREKSTMRVKIWRLKQKVKKLEDEKLRRPICNGSVEHIIHLARKYIEGPALDFFESQLTVCKRKKNGRRYSENVISWATDLYSESRMAYKFLSKTFTMPHTTYIKSCLKKRLNANAESGNVIKTTNDSSQITEGNLHKTSDCSSALPNTVNNNIQGSNDHEKCNQVSAATIGDANLSENINNSPLLLQVSEFTPGDINLPANVTSERNNDHENCDLVSLQISEDATNIRNTNLENANPISLKVSQAAIRDSDLPANVTSERNNELENCNSIPMQISEVAICDYKNITPILLQFSDEI